MLIVIKFFLWGNLWIKYTIICPWEYYRYRIWCEYDGVWTTLPNTMLWVEIWKALTFGKSADLIWSLSQVVQIELNHQLIFYFYSDEESILREQNKCVECLATELYHQIREEQWNHKSASTRTNLNIIKTINHKDRED